MSGESQFSNLEKRIQLLEAQLNKLEGTSSAAASHPLAGERHSYTIRAHFSRVALERKPFAVTLEVVDITRNVTRSLTPIRTAILIVLLMDYLERGEQGETKREIAPRIKDTLQHILPGEEQVSPEALRVAFYRAGQFIEEEFGAESEQNARFVIEQGRLVLMVRGIPVPPQQVEVELTSSDQALSAYFDRSLATSPLGRLRKNKALYVPPGQDGQDRLVMELIDHASPIRQTTLFYRPTIVTFPPELLTKLGVSETRRRRHSVMQRAFTDGRAQYTEILQRRTIWDLIRRAPGRGFLLYPDSATAIDVVQHIDSLIFMVQTQPSFELVLTDAFFPFYINTTEISGRDGIERFVLFFQNAEENNLREVSVFALKDDSVYFSTHERIIRWVLAHPTTVRDRDSVLEELRTLKRALVSAIENPSNPEQHAFRAMGTLPPEGLIAEPPLAAQIELNPKRGRGQKATPKAGRGGIGAETAPSRPRSSR